MTLDLSPQLSKLFCELKLDRINKEYNIIESKYHKIDEMFNLPEDEKTNIAIATAYTQFYKDTDKFCEVLNFAQKQIREYHFLLNIQLKNSTCSRKICEKKLDKTISTEWLKDIGILVQYCKDIDSISQQLTNTKQRVKDLSDRLRTGINCMGENLKMEEIRLADYTGGISRAAQTLDYFTYNKDKLNPYGLAVMLQFIKSNLYKMDEELPLKFHDTIKRSTWLENRLYNVKSEEKKGELKEKFEKADAIAIKYKGLYTKCRGSLNHHTLKKVRLVKLLKN